LVYKHPFDISVVSSVLGITYAKFYRWFKECLTDFKTPKVQETLHQNDFDSWSGGKHKRVLVPILRPEHVGSHMAIDEKHINGQF
jgi:hypothetical protein